MDEITSICALIKMVYTSAWNRFACALCSFIINGLEIIYSWDVLKIIDKTYHICQQNLNMY